MYHHHNPNIPRRKGRDAFLSADSWSRADQGGWAKLLHYTFALYETDEGWFMIIDCTKPPRQYRRVGPFPTALVAKARVWDDVNEDVGKHWRRLMVA